MFGTRTVVPVAREVVGPKVGTRGRHSARTNALSNDLVARLQQAVGMGVSTAAEPVVVPRVVFTPPGRFTPAT